MHNYSPEDILLYLYKETSPEQTADIEAALKNDWTLREKMLVMKTAMERLNNIVETPRTEVVLEILKHARAAAEIKTA